MLLLCLLPSAALPSRQTLTARSPAGPSSTCASRPVLAQLPQARTDLARCLSLPLSVKPEWILDSVKAKQELPLHRK